MSIIYPVIFTETHDEKDTYLIEIPDLDGFTEGYGLQDAIKMTRDYIGCACYDKEELPEASSLSEIDASKGTFASDGDSFTTLVDLDLEAYRRKMNNRAVRRNVSIPAWLNQMIEEKHVNVSKVLQEALKEKFGIA